MNTAWNLLVVEDNALQDNQCEKILCFPEHFTRLVQRDRFACVLGQRLVAQSRRHDVNALPGCDCDADKPMWKNFRPAMEKIFVDQHATAQTMLPRIAPCPTSLCRWSCPVGFANPALVS